MQLDNEICSNLAKTVQGREFIKMLEAELTRLDIASRSMTGETLEHNTADRRALDGIIKWMKPPYISSSVNGQPPEPWRP